nr:hypothetical protein Itr_chr08CG03490 [Ipomoea trifida]
MDVAKYGHCLGASHGQASYLGALVGDYVVLAGRPKSIMSPSKWNISFGTVMPLASDGSVKHKSSPVDPEVPTGRFTCLANEFLRI